MTTKEKQPEMTKGSPIFECSPGIPIIEKTTRHKVKKMKYLQDMKTSTMMTSLEMQKTKKAFEEETYEEEHPSDRENDPSNDIIKNQNQNYQEDTTIENDGP